MGSASGGSTNGVVTIVADEVDPDENDVAAIGVAPACARCC
jgi:hypothetical protein